MAETMPVAESYAYLLLIIGRVIIRFSTSKENEKVTQIICNKNEFDCHINKTCAWGGGLPQCDVFITSNDSMLKLY